MPLKYPTTSRTLLDRIASGDEIGWDEFYAKYSPIIRSLAKAKGLDDDAADDIRQQVMLQFFKQSRSFRFDPGIARFRTYFGRIIRAKIADFCRKRKEMPSEEVAETAADPQAGSLFLAEWRKLILREAEEELKKRVTPETFQAYQLYAVQERPAEKVAAFLDCSVNQVYLAKKRCFAMMREILRKMNEADPDLRMELSRYD